MILCEEKWKVESIRTIEEENSAVHAIREPVKRVNFHNVSHFYQIFERKFNCGKKFVRNSVPYNRLKFPRIFSFIYDFRSILALGKIVHYRYSRARQK
jgi:hypothetical protein